MPCRVTGLKMRGMADQGRGQLDSLINAYDLHWDRAQTSWKKAEGFSVRLKMLGFQGSGRGRVEQNFWSFPGFYVLYRSEGAGGRPSVKATYSAVYFGIARSGVGKRIHEHTKDRLRPDKSWDSFSWFAYGDLIDRKRSRPEPRSSAWGGKVLWKAAVFDLEAAMIRALSPPENRGHGSFRLRGIAWDQVTRTQD